MKHSTIVLLAISAVALAGCKKASPPAATAIHDIKGSVIAVNVAAGQVTIAAEEADGKIGSEHRVFTVADPSLLTGLWSGDRIEGKFRDADGGRTLMGLCVIIPIDIEFFCPMHPRIVRNVPDKCPVCAMPLSKKKKDPAADDAQVEKTIGKMAPEDRALIKAQRFCPVLDRARLALDGPPVKVILDGKTVFLCCEACLPMAKTDPAKTLRKVRSLQEAAAPMK